MACGPRPDPRTSLKTALCWHKSRYPQGRIPAASVAFALPQPILDTAPAPTAAPWSRRLRGLSVKLCSVFDAAVPNRQIGGVRLASPFRCGLLAAGACFLCFFFLFLSGVLFFFVSLFFKINLLCAVLPPSPPPPPSLPPLASIACARCSPVWSSSRLFPVAVLFLPAWLVRVPPSLVPLLAVVSAVGRLVGRWPRWLPRPGVCRCCPVRLPPLASSFLCSLNFF